MNAVVHFEVPADDVSRAKDFYTKCFGWKMQDFPEMEYTMAQTTKVDENQMPTEPGAINGGIFQRQADMPHPQFYVKVEDIDASLAQVEQSGGKIVRKKTTVGDMGFAAQFKDSEGNVVGLWQNA